jgi:hypothetical protein
VIVTSPQCKIAPWVLRRTNVVSRELSVGPVRVKGTAGQQDVSPDHCSAFRKWRRSLSAVMTPNMWVRVGIAIQ